MGVIKRQGFKQSIVTLAATALGAINTLLVYPMYLETTEIGLLSFLISTAGLFAPFIGLGHQTFAIRYFPEFHANGKDDRGFLTFMLLGLTAGFLIFAPLLLYFSDTIIAYLPAESPLSARYFPFAVFFALLILLQTFFASYISNYKRIVIPSVLMQHAKVTQPVLVILYFFSYISLNSLVWGLLFSYIASVLGMVAYLYSLSGLKLQFNFSYFNRQRLREMYTFAAYGTLGSLGSVLATRIDIVMVTYLASEHQTGVYAIAVFIAGVIEIPLMALNKITAPIISAAFKNNDMAHVEELYKKSGLNLLIFGFALFLLIVLGLDNLFLFMKNGETFAAGKNAIILLGAAKLFDILTSVNGYIIGYSKYFRFNFYTMLILAGLNVVTNYFFITAFAISGAALATFVTVVIFNTLKGLYIWYRFKMHPFTPQTFWLLGIGTVCFALVFPLPDFGVPLLDIAYKSLIFSGLYTGICYYCKISEDFNVMVRKVLPLP